MDTLTADIEFLTRYFARLASDAARRGDAALAREYAEQAEHEAGRLARCPS